MHPLCYAPLLSCTLNSVRYEERIYIYHMVSNPHKFCHKFCYCSIYYIVTGMNMNMTIKYYYIII